MQDEITRIMEKLETASNLGKAGALTGPEFAQLRDFVKASRYLAEENQICAEKLTRAIREVVRTSEAPIPF